MDMVTTVQVALLQIHREWAIERSSVEISVVVAPFVATLVLLGGLAFGPAPGVLQASAPGLLWLVTIVAAIPLGYHVAAAEHRDDTWDQLRCLVPATALLAGKLAAVWVGLFVTWLVAGLLVATVIAGVAATPVALAGGLLGTLGLAAVTTVFGVLTGGGSRRSGLFAVLVLPAALPALVAGTETATPQGAGGAWLGLLVVYDAVVVTASWAVFPALLEE